MTELIERFVKMVKECNDIVFFGGAGTSTESGIKDYRSEDGLYSTVNEYGVSPEVILSHTFFYEHPDVFYNFYGKYFLADIQPNITHYALAELEKQGNVNACVTQNVDSLHQKAGSENVLELHGNARKFKCVGCNYNPDTEEVVNIIKSGEVPRCKLCSAIIKPEVVLYEERLDDIVIDKTVNEISKADMLIIGGTSLSVYPAASFIEYFKGKYIAVINKGETSRSVSADVVINDSLGKVFTFLSDKMSDKA